MKLFDLRRKVKKKNSKQEQKQLGYLNNLHKVHPKTHKNKTNKTRQIYVYLYIQTQAHTFFLLNCPAISKSVNHCAYIDCRNILDISKMKNPDGEMKISEKKTKNYLLGQTKLN